MPAGLIRFYGTGDLHFITCSCYRRRSYLEMASRRDLFLEILEQTRRRYRFVIAGYVVMPEHFHLLISEPQVGTPSTVMQVLKQRFSRQMSKELAPPVWQKRFYDFNVWQERKRIEKLRYIHRNPVQRGLVWEAEQWKWSSFRFYLSGEPESVGVNDGTVMVLRVRPPAA